MSELEEGDRITIGVTHTIRIDGENSWIKFEINSAVKHGETTEVAIDRVDAVVAQNIISLIESQAAPVVRANAAQR